MVIAKPMHVVMVMAEPRTCAGAFAATSAENCGESATTIKPQKNSTEKKKIGERDQMKGEIRQQIPEVINAACAIFLLPKVKDSFPPSHQPAAPEAITKNASNDG